MTEAIIHVRAASSLKRQGEPVTCGVPFPKGMLAEASSLQLLDAGSAIVPMQTRTLDRWSDGSARWILLDWQGTEGDYRLRVTANQPARPANSLKLAQEGDKLWVQTGTTTFEIVTKPAFLLRSLTNPVDPVSSGILSIFGFQDEHGATIPPTANQSKFPPRVTSVELEESGPLRACVRINGELDGPSGAVARMTLRYHFFAGSSVVRFHVTLTNHHKSDHPGGLWDLGNGGKLLLKSMVAAFIPGSPTKDAKVRYSAEPGKPFSTAIDKLEIYQDSSGGDNWKSSNHLNRNRIVPNTFQGYRTRVGKNERTGLRATPIVQLDRGEVSLAVSMPQFWQNFPKAITADENSLVLELFPSQYADLHEIQGGEQKTHIYYAAFTKDTITDSPLEWTRNPLIPVIDPTWVAQSGAIAYLTPKSTDPHPDYLKLVDSAIEGTDTFDRKREAIDEFGWRHFGDIYGDHEAVFHPGPTPLVSHYNNQYDAIAGFACQFFRSGDTRWFRMMNELAAHVSDIDIYHTDEDKAAYNHGLFWHTYHYVDADTGTHRSYPKAGRIPPLGKPVPGGGPASEQNYATGLMLHYFLTGDALSRDAAIGLARWVIDMDDGNNTVFRRLSKEHTGIASASRDPSYHGPGRGPGNSISALLDGFQLTRDRSYLAKAEQLIHRCVHPTDNIDRLLTLEANGVRLVDAENRWFYTMFLQSLGKYLNLKAEHGELDYCYAYGRASLLHYARWMIEREAPYLQHPEILEYPTETWAAQDLRKCEVFQFAALHASPAEKANFLERAEYFFRASVAQLSGMPTRTLCRPVVLLLSFGWSRAWFKQNPDAQLPAPRVETSDFGRPEVFAPQKFRAIKRFKQLVLAGGIIGLAAIAGLVIWLVR
jgi:hypothetical protein